MLHPGAPCGMPYSALEEKPTSTRSVDSFGNFPLKFVLYVVYYGTNSGQCRILRLDIAFPSTFATEARHCGA